MKLLKTLNNGSLLDSTGNGNDGTLTAGNGGFRYTERGQAMLFDGADTKIDTGSDFIGIGACTIRAWIKLRSFGEGVSSVSSYFLNNNKTTFFLDSNDEAFAFTSDFGTTAQSANNSVKLNIWQRVVVTRTSAGVTNFYINGVSSGSADQDSGTPETGTTNVILGNNNIQDRSVDGFIQDVIVDDEVLSLAEIEADYNNTKDQYGTVQTKNNFYYPSPTDLSNERNTTLSTTDSLLGWDFTSGWNTAGGGSVDDSNTFTTSATGGLTTSTTILVEGNRYTMRIAGTTTASEFRVRDSATATYYKVINSATFDETFTFIAASGGKIYLQNDGIGTNTITTMTLQAYDGLVAAYNMEAQNGTVIDISGNGNNGTITGALDTKGATGRALAFDGVDDKITPTQILLGGDFTISFLAKPTIGTTYQIITNDNGESNARGGISIYSNLWQLREIDAAGGNVARTTSFKTGEWQKVVFTQVGTTAKAYFNGVLETTETGITPITQIDNIGWGDDANEIGYAGDLDEFKVYNRGLSAQEIKDDYNKYANQISYIEDFSDEGADNVVKLVRGHIKGTGDYKVGELSADSGILHKGTKYLECDTAGTEPWQSEQAYGTWEFSINTANGNTAFQFISDTKLVRPDMNGYYLVIGNNKNIALAEITDPTATLLFNTANDYISENTYYPIKVTRTAAGVFTVYIRGGAFGDNNWTTVVAASGTNPVTDNTHTTSKYSVLDFDVGDRITKIIYRKGIQQ